MQSIALYNLKIPKDVIDIICSFNFYTLQECIEITKNKYKKVVNELNYIERFQYYGYQICSGIYYHIQIRVSTYDEADIHSVLNICICIKCKEFIKNMPTSKCKCIQS